MKNKLNSYIKKLKPLLDKIKPWIKTKRAWIEIGLSLVAIICFILAGVSSCGRNNYAYIETTPEPTLEATAKPTEMVTATPAVTATPVATATPTATSTPATGSNTENTQVIYGEDPSVPDYSSSASSASGTAPTGVPLYTPVPEASVDTKAEAYRTVVESCSASTSYSKYYLYDMDSDGVDELILHHGTDDYEAYIDIYTFTDSGLIFVGDVTGSFANVAGDSNGGIIIYYRRDINGQSYESIDQLEKTGVDIVVNSISISEQVDSYTVLESNVDIPSYSITDLSPLS